MLLHAVTLVISLVAPADFASAQENANKLKSLAKAVTVLVGDCPKGDEVDQQICRNTMIEKEKMLRRKDVYIYLGPVAGELLFFDGMRGEKARIVWTAVHDAKDGIALTLKKPTGVGGNGIVVPKSVIDGTLAPGVLESDLKRLSRLGMIAVELVGEFGPAFHLQGTSKPLRGVVFNARVLRFSNAKTGKPIMEAQL